MPPPLRAHNPAVGGPGLAHLVRPLALSPRGLLLRPPAAMLHPDFRAHADPRAMRRAVSAVRPVVTVRRGPSPPAAGVRPLFIPPTCNPDDGSCVPVTPTAHPLPTATPVTAPVGTAVVPTVSGASGASTGMKRWWAYDPAPVFGIGTSMVNMVTGNLMVAANDDLSFPNMDVPLRLHRVYNSQSNHDAAGDDGGYPSMFGNGWTNELDAHLMLGPNGGLTVFDQTGTRYDYTPDGSGGWLPPAGVYSTLVFDGGAGYQWTDKSGRVLYFYSPTAAQYAAQYTTVAGRLYMILGRNRNVFVRFNYYYAGGSGAAGSLIDHVVLQTQSNVSATLQFGNAGGHQELLSVTWPDGSMVSYAYDGSGNLAAVWRPGNGSGTPANTLQEQYAYKSGTALLSYAYGPRWINTAGASGGYRMWSNYDAGGRPGATTAAGVENFTPADGTGTVLQPNAPTGISALNTTVYAYAGNQTQLTDVDGHNRFFTYDGSGRVTQRSDQVTPALALSVLFTWDTANNLGSVTDARNNMTNFLYDGNGNVSAVGGPLTTTSQGTFRPTQLIDHDAFNNVTAYCDAYQSHTANIDWPVGYTVSENPSLPTPCAQLTGGRVPYTRATYAFPASEPYGQLATAVNPLGYTQTITYDPGHQSGQDFGLPTQVVGRVAGALIQQTDGTLRDPGTGAFYDTNGNVICYATGSGRFIFGYDAMGRNTSEADPDDSVSPAGCPKPNSQPGWNTAVAIVRLSNGQIASTQTPSERLAGVSTTLAYDEDGNTVSQTTHNAGIAGTTKFFYDGADRLVEAQQPTAATEAPWATRYLYDLTGQPANYAGVTVTGHGNAVDTRRIVNHVWLDLAMQSFDALDRVATQYGFAPCPSNGATGAVACFAPPFATNYTYDAGASQGLLTSVTDPLGQTKMYGYDAQGNVLGVQYGGDAGVTPAMSYTYDAAGRLSSSNAANLGTMQYTYDANGVLASRQEPVALGNALTTYTNYADGMLAGISFAGTVLNQPNLFQYAYRRDGMPQTQTINYRSQSSIAYTFTAAGRPLTVTDVGPAPSQTRQYDTSGRLSSYTIPAGTYGAFSYDPEGRTIAYQGYGGENVSLAWNVRGELTGENFNPNPIGNLGETWPAFGLISNLGTFVQDSSQAWDARTGAVLALGGNAYAYDAAGRLTAGPQGQSYAYDAENRLVSGANDKSYVPQNCGGYWTPQNVGRSNGLSLARYIYGPEGNVAQTVENVIGGGQSTTTRHWDGDAPFILENAGTLVSVLAGANASVGVAASDVTGLNVIDRDPFGDATSRHNGTGYDTWSAPNPYGQVCVTGGPAAPSPGYQPGARAADALVFRSIGALDDGFNTMEGNSVVSPSTVSMTTPQGGGMPYAFSMSGFLGGRHLLSDNGKAGYCPDGYSYSEVNGCQFDPAMKQCPDGAWAQSCATYHYDPCALECVGPNLGGGTSYRAPMPRPQPPPFPNPTLIDRSPPPCIPYDWSLTGSHEATKTTAAHRFGVAIGATAGAMLGSRMGGKATGGAEWGQATGATLVGPGVPGLEDIFPGPGATAGGKLGDIAYKWEYPDAKPTSLFGLPVCKSGSS